MVQVVPSLAAWAGGPSRSVPRLCSALADAGCDVELVTSDFGWPRVDLAPLRESGVRLRLVPARSWLRRKLRWGAGLRPAIDEAAADADILHSHGMWLPANHAPAVVARRRGLPHVIAPRGMLTAYGLRQSRWRKRIARWLYAGRDLRDAACLHATSREEARDLRRLRGLRRPVAVVPNGIDAPPDVRPGSRPARLKAAPDGKRVLLYLSRIHPLKGPMLLADAWGRLYRRHGDWHLVIAGGDETGHRPEVEARLRATGADAAATFVGPLDDARKWAAYAAADLFVLPSHSEGFGMVVAEALAAGTPVVTTVGTPWSELEELRCGWRTEIDAREIEAALDEAMGLTDTERAEMGRRGRQLVRDRYAWPVVAEKMRNVYRWVIAGGQAPSCVDQA